MSKCKLLVDYAVAECLQIQPNQFPGDIQYTLF